MSRKNTPVVANDWTDPAPKKVKTVRTEEVQAQTCAPIVQPIAVVPYTMPQQNIFQTPSFDEEYYEDEYVEEAAPAVVVAPAKKTVKFIPILLAVFSLLIIAVMVIGKFALQAELAILDKTSGLDFIMGDLIDCFEGKFEIAKIIVPGSVAIVALFTLINFIVSLCTMFKKGASVLSKICIFFMLVFSLVLVLIGLVDGLAIGYGLYAVAGLSLLSLLFGYLARK